MHYIDTNEIEVDGLKKRLSLLMVTATEVETLALHAKISPLPGYPAILKIHRGNQTYYVGVFGAYGVVHVQCDMGAVSRGGALITAKDAIDDWSPKAVLMVGIAFGIDKRKQKVGDVLISESLAPYDIKREGEENVVFRSPMPASGAVFANRFKNFRGCSYKLPTGREPNIIVGQLLSGETLIDNLQYRDKLLAAFPSAKGGEMEGAGLYAAAAAAKLEWIIVKSICDFADGKKRNNKKKNQEIAAESAVALCHSVMSSKMAFTALGFMPIENQEATHEVDPEIIKKILFEVYSPQSEAFYLKRSIDDDFISISSLQSVWLTGYSGCGKTSIIYRALCNLTDKPLIISLASCVRDIQLTQLFECFLFEVQDYLGIPKTKNIWGANNELINYISQVLSENFNGSSPIFIHLDEIPIENETLFKEFIDMLLAIIMEYNRIGTGKVRFFVSSINDPRTCIKSFQKKIVEYIKIVEVPAWNATEIKSLIYLVSNGIDVKLQPKDFDILISAANGSPRFVKRFFWNYLMFSSIDGWYFDRIIVETTKEIQI